MEEFKCKVIIISGFLGSGKTTLIERIIKAPELSAKVGIIQNEFSA
jgi:G3E family GTPase